MAGASHGSLASAILRAKKYARDFGTEIPIDWGMNRINMEHVFDAALHHLTRWMDGGEAAPIQPLIEFAGTPADVMRDARGTAVGGVRLPQADVPLGQNTATPRTPDIFSLLRGAYHPFAAPVIDDLYTDETDFVRQFTAAAQRAEASGVLLPRDIAPLIEDAITGYREARGLAS